MVRLLKPGAQGSAWLAWLGVVVAVAATARLGLWQLDRAAQKIALERSWVERNAMPPLATGQLARSVDALVPQLHRRIEITGRWMARHTWALDNRPHDGYAGLIVVTPLLLGPGEAVLVQRGWTPRDPNDRTRLPAGALPEGEVRFEARIAEWPSHRLELSETVERGPLRQNLDPAELARETGVSFRPLSLLQLGGGASGDALVREWPIPAQDVWKHKGYALQWFAMSAAIAATMLWYRFIRPRREQRS